MINEPITFDPAVKEIAREVSRLVARVRARFSAGARRSDYGTAA